MMVIGNESVPIQLSQCWFFGLAISNAKLLIYSSTKIYENNFIKQRSETAVFEISKMVIGILKKYIYSVIYYTFRHTFSWAAGRASGL